ncbi:KptA family-domain-containing protein [Dendryphion nanum]|uniref:2'-phosphotransferase n=1 Tax=Dendryphion nanum TaxID=256645 RepID=A0A9P9EDT3_9PLEO|nr:KptA family-domain-containing protein [Dendryphion nanum]
MSSRRGGGAGGGRGGKYFADMPREQQISRALSRLLRHSAQQEGLKLGKGGYAALVDVLNARPVKGFKITLPELKNLIASNDKQRFSLILASSLQEGSEKIESEIPTSITEQLDSDDPADYLIRANQGHSIQVDNEGLLTAITEEAGNVPEVCVHGTDEAAWEWILKGGGLRKFSRNHIHFAAGLPAGFKSVVQDGGDIGEKEAAPVISGMRKSSTVLIYVDLKKALGKGVKFFKSENGVILTEGDGKGLLSYEFFKRVESRKKGGGVLMSDGELPEGVKVDVEAWEKEFAGRRQGGGRGGRGGRGRARVNDDSRDVLAGF